MAMIFREPEPKLLVGALIAVATGSALGYWGAAEYEHQERRNDVPWLVQDTSCACAWRLRPNRRQPVSKEEVSRALYDHAAVVDRYLGKLREHRNARVSAILPTQWKITW